MKKGLILVTIGLMLASSVIGCGKKTDVASEQSQTVEVQQATDISKETVEGAKEQAESASDTKETELITEAETSDFQGLEVIDETEIQIEEGEEVVIE